MKKKILLNILLLNNAEWLIQLTSSSDSGLIDFNKCVIEICSFRSGLLINFLLESAILKLYSRDKLYVVIFLSFEFLKCDPIELCNTNQLTIVFETFDALDKALTHLPDLLHNNAM